MTEECRTNPKSHHSTLWLKWQRTAQHVTQTSDSKIIVMDDVAKQVPDIMELRIAENLSLSGNQLSCIPINLADYTNNLIHLDLSDNQLNDLPNTLNQLKNLRHLSLDRNRFSHLPSVIGELNNLRTLSARKNFIDEIPTNVTQLTNLEDLDLCYNVLKDLPSVCASLNLRKLSLECNKFKQIPGCIIKGMFRLRVLDLSQNSSLDLSFPPGSINLRQLYARNNGTCRSFPKWILSSKFPDLELVVLDSTKFERYPLNEESSGSRLKVLSMQQCKLSDSLLAKIIAKTQNLQKLIIGNVTVAQTKNYFWNLPLQSLEQPLGIKELDISDTAISVLPKEIGHLLNLSKIVISFNEVSWLPNEICSLNNLESLIANNNQVTSLPEDLGKMVSLKELKLGHNYLTRIPDSIKLLKRLQFLDLYDNELSSFPNSIEELTNLTGLDMEQNFFSTEKSSIDRDVHYEGMRAVLRAYWCDDYKILDGPKLESSILDDDDEDGDLAKRSRCSSMSDDEKSLCAVPDDANWINNLPNEHWDTSDDSTDEFDPNVPKEPRMRTYPPCTFYQPYQRVYCPADLHKQRITTRIMEMLRNGTLVWSTNFEEGQFEDPCIN